MAANECGRQLRRAGNAPGTLPFSRPIDAQWKQRQRDADCAGQIC